MLSSFKAKISRMNGWRRAWLVLSLLGIFYATFIHALQEAGTHDLSRYKYKWAVEANLNNPECQPYISKPFNTLSEPPFTLGEGKTGCYYLFNYRKHNNQTTVPYNKEQLDKDFFYELWSDRGALVLFYGAFAVAISALVYFGGFLVAWVLAGFRRGGKE